MCVCTHYVYCPTRTSLDERNPEAFKMSTFKKLSCIRISKTEM